MHDEEQTAQFGRRVEINERLGRLETALAHVEDKLRGVDAEIHKLLQWRAELQDKIAVVMFISSRIEEMCNDMRVIRNEIHSLTVRLARMEGEKEAALRGRAELDNSHRTVSEWIRWAIPGGWLVAIMAGLGALGVWLMERLR